MASKSHLITPTKYSLGKYSSSNFHCFIKSNKPTLNNMWLVHIPKLATFRACRFLSFHPHIGLLSIAHHHLWQWHKHVASPRYLRRLLQRRAICAASLPLVSHEHPKPGFKVNASRRGVRTAPPGWGPRYPHNPPSTMLLTCLPCRIVQAHSSHLQTRSRLVYEDIATVMPPFLRRLTRRWQWWWPHDYSRNHTYLHALSWTLKNGRCSPKSDSWTAADMHSQRHSIFFTSDGVNNVACWPPQPLGTRSTLCCCFMSSNNVNVGEATAPHPQLQYCQMADSLPVLTDGPFCCTATRQPSQCELLIPQPLPTTDHSTSQ